MSLLAELDYPARPRHAVFSPCRTYRYALSRVWAADKPYALFIGLNPSTADETLDDPTIRRCIDFAKRWGYGGLVMANLFAYRATNPSEMKAATDPVGVANDEWLIGCTLLNHRTRANIGMRVYMNIAVAFYAWRESNEIPNHTIMFNITV